MWTLRGAERGCASLGSWVGALSLLATSVYGSLVIAIS